MLASVLAAVLATEELEDAVDTGGGEIVLLVGFIVVGIIGAVIAARVARRNRYDGWHQDENGEPV